VVSNNPVVPLLFNESRDFPLSFLDLNSPQNREDAMNDQRCPKCKKLMLAMTDRTGKTELRCVKCDKVDPMKTDAVKWANSGLSGPTNAA
jgi:phage FluMu protein Com